MCPEFGMKWIKMAKHELYCVCVCVCCVCCCYVDCLLAWNESWSNCGTDSNCLLLPYFSSATIAVTTTALFLSCAPVWLAGWLADKQAGRQAYNVIEVIHLHTRWPDFCLRCHCFSFHLSFSRALLRCHRKLYVSCVLYASSFQHMKWAASNGGIKWLLLLVRINAVTKYVMQLLLRRYSSLFFSSSSTKQYIREFSEWREKKSHNCRSESNQSRAIHKQ